MKGFSLAELLITLGILGALAVFTIPMLTQDSQPQLADKQTRIARDVARMLAFGYERYRSQTTDTLTMRSADLFPYLNYLKVDTTSVTEGTPGTATQQCEPNRPCLILHNGGLLRTWYDGFCDTAPTAVVYDFTPSLKVTGADSNKALRFYLYRDGRIRTDATMDPNTRWNANVASGTNCTYTRNPGSTVALWFQGF